MEWGPWIEHDGGRGPKKGTSVDVVRANGVSERFIVGTHEYHCVCPLSYFSTKTWWIWVDDTPRFGEVIRYRIRKPLGLTILETILNELPAPTKETVYHG